MQIQSGWTVPLSAECSLLRAEGFSCSLDVLHGGIGISKLQYFYEKKFSDVKKLQYLVINPWIRT
jgi:hypothetical protein